LRTTQLLFSYGLIRDEKAQLSVLERKLKGKPDTMVGYKIYDKLLKNKYPAITKTHNPKDMVQGMLFNVSNLDLFKIDTYKSLVYSRTSVTLKSGTKAWVYMPNLN